MALDNFGREINGMSGDDLANQMSQPVSSTGLSDIVSQLADLAKAQRDSAKRIERAIAASYTSNSDISKKLEDLRKAVQANIDAARQLNQKIKESAKTRNANGGLTEKGVNNIIRKHMQPSSELKSIEATITSKNTVHVKDRELRRMTKHLLGLVETLNGFMSDSLKSSGGKGSSTGRRKKSVADAADLDFVTDEGGSKRSRRRRGSGVDAGDLGFATDGSGSGTSVDRRIEAILRKQFRRLFRPGSDKFMPRVTGNNFSDFPTNYAKYQQNIKEFVKLRRIEGKELSKIVSLEEFRSKFQSQFTASELREIATLQQKIALTDNSIEGMEKRQQLLNKYHEELAKIADRIGKEQQSKAFWEPTKKLARETAAVLDNIHQWGYGYSASAKMTEGLLENHRRWVQDSGQIAFHQQGITSEIQKQDSLVTRIFSFEGARSEALARTGKSMAKLQQQQLANQKKGLKDASTANRLAEKGLYLSTAIGSSSELTAENIRSWHMEMGMSERNIGRLSAGIQQTARATGLVGDEMMKAVDATRQAIENMRNLGVLTGDAAAQFVKLNASAQKFGVGGKMGEITNFLTQDYTKLASNPRMTTLAMNAANRAPGLNEQGKAELRHNIAFGTVDEGDIKNVMAGIKATFFDITGGRKLSELSVEQKQQVQGIMNALGMKLGEYDQLIKSIDEANMTYVDQMKRLQADRKKMDESQLSGMEKAQLGIRESGLTFGEASRLLSKSAEGKKFDTTDASSLKAFGAAGLSQDRQQDVLLDQAMKAYQASRQQAMKAGASSYNLGPGLTSADLRKAQSGGPEAVQEFLSKAEAADQRLNVEMQRLADPITKQTQLLQSINDVLQTRLGGIVTWLTDNPLFRGLSTLSGIGANFMTLINQFHGWRQAFKDFREMSKNIDLFASEATTPGSIYVEDIHLPAYLEAIETAIYNSGGAGGGHSDLDIGGKKRRKGRKGKGKVSTSRPRGVGDAMAGRRRAAAKKLRKQRSMSRMPKGRGGGGKIAGLAGLGGTLLGGLNMMGWEAPGQDMIDSGMQMADVASNIKEGTQLLSKNGGKVGDLSRGLGTKMTGMIETVGTKITSLGSSSGVTNAVKGLGSKITGVTGAIGSKITGATGKITGATGAIGGKLAGATGATGAIGGKLAGATGMLGKASGATRALGASAGKVLPFLAPLVGGVTGAMEANSVGRGTAEGAILGALTGDADTGSMFSSWLGIEKGSVGDEALGIAGAAGTGALTGAAIGSVVPVVGTGIGAAIGAVVGSGAELYKIFTKPDSPLRKTLVGWGEGLWDGVKNAGSFVLQGGVVGWGMREAYNTLADPKSPVRKKLGEWGSGLWTGIKDVGSFMLTGGVVGWGAKQVYDSLTNPESPVRKKITEWGAAISTSLQSITKAVGNTLTSSDFTNRLQEGTKIAGALAMASMVPGAALLASPVLTSMSSVEQKVKEDEITSDPDKKGTQLASGINGVTDNTAETVNQLKILVSQMQTFITLMSQGGTSSPQQLATRGAPRANIVFDYNTWQLGKFDSNASRGPVIPDGLV